MKITTDKNTISPAQKSDLPAIFSIVHTTISEIYPHYYPKGAVDFFLNLHNEQSIAQDISDGYVYLYKLSGEPVATFTIRENEIARLFVLPDFQGRGIGTEILDFSEQQIFEMHDNVVLHASLSAKSIYLKRGYREIEYRTKKMENSDYLCVDIMQKKKADA